MREGVEIRSGRTAMGGGPPLQWTVLEVAPEVEPQLLLDPRFLHQGIVRGGGLIDLAATEKNWGSPPGYRPEEWLADAPLGSFAFCPTNWGWQFGSWLYQDGVLRGLPGDSLPRTPRWFLGWGEGRGWQAEERSLDAQWHQQKVGLEMPAILQAAEVVPLSELLQQDRLLADLRNVFDFFDGRGPTLPADFWSVFRKVLPRSAEEAQCLLEGGSVVLPLKVLGEEGRSWQALLDTLDLPGFHSGKDGLALRGPFPRARLPIFALGATAAGSLIVLAIDGRQSGLPGATVEEAAEVLRREGALVGGLGSAGGDVSLVEKTPEANRLWNQPSTRDPVSGAGISRRVPAVLLV